jgi:hypothetical protein
MRYIMFGLADPDRVGRLSGTIEPGCQPGLDHQTLKEDRATMSAQPPFHQFRRPASLHDGAQATPDSFNGASPWDEAMAPDDEQENWHYSRPGAGYTDSSGTEVYPRVLRMVLIGVLSLLSWAMVAALWQAVARVMN